MNKRQKRRKRQQRNQTAMRSRTVFFEENQKETTMHKSIFEFLSSLGNKCLVLVLTAIAVIAVLGISQAYSNPTDWHDNELSEQISQKAREEARKLWRKEHGDWQPNLTETEQKRLLKLTALLQAERDKEQR
ncbi:hypothetical protein [Rodentibacter haemolyticus]|uniref:Cell division protein FtsN n=1 Tax=Rodentibacter haemolyticus TaxID=2778911 RepID=A0ABX6V0U6_9PAST|nr:hypothetical protein [Rodentibacter haemolyticus]QPB43747.1 hypothetical protein IHV77_09775 [Rodentibacter haemolyticus]